MLKRNLNIHRSLLISAICLPALSGAANPLKAGANGEPCGAATDSFLRVLTLNVAHGRSDGPNQLLLDKSRFPVNLARVSRVLRDARADIVGLQEVDGPSRWSGRFDHAKTMADQANYPWHFRAGHARSWLFDYGTAVLSRLPLRDTLSHRFAPTPPTPRKGFVMAQVPVPAAGAGERLVDVFSVHFDFLSRRARTDQVAELLATLTPSENPTVVLGDFNSDWQDPDSPIRQLTETTGLVAYDPAAPDLATHEGKRIDWILVSRHFEFRSYRVLPSRVSDHQPVLAEVELKSDGGTSPGCVGSESGNAPTGGTAH